MGYQTGIHNNSFSQVNLNCVQSIQLMGEREKTDYECISQPSQLLIEKILSTLCNLFI